MPNINPRILQWARETAGLTPEEAVRKLGVKAAHGMAAAERLAALEAGDAQPTRAMLVKMAKQYRRPLITFYLKDIPPQGEHGEDFRTLSGDIDEADRGLVDAVVRNIAARQSLVRASLEASGDARHLPFIGSMTRRNGVAAVVASIKQTLGFERDVFRERGGLAQSFAYVRGLVEAAGIFVLLVDNLGSWHTTIKVEAFRGFAIADEVAPFVAVNANDSPAAWSFTLIHELAHLWIGASGISGGGPEHGVEKFCNDVAGEFLLPRSELGNLATTATGSFKEAISRISAFADAHNVSKTMVAYKLYRAGVFNLERYQEFEAFWRQKFFEQKAAKKEQNAKKGGGPSYYAVRKHRIGTTLIQLVEQMMHDGNLSVTKAGIVLGVGTHNVYALLKRGRPSHSV